MYHRKHWLDRRGEPMTNLCFITKTFVKPTNDQNNQENGSAYRTREEQKHISPNREAFSRADLEKLPELHPPDIMPNGNVGTPTMVFLRFIKECRLPQSVIKKLGLSFPKIRSNKKYGNVPLDYGTGVVEGSDSELSVRTGAGHEIHTAINDTHKTPEANKTSSLSEKVATKRRKIDEENKNKMAENIEERLIERENSSESEEDADACEEWERHEAVYDDPDNQERNKERLFEEEIELKWEKGGSGLVFYTDAQYWQEQEGDFDEQTADDWDVDMSAYYEKGAGDKDIRDFITIREEKRRREGIDGTDRFTVGSVDKSNYDQLKIGKFEKYTKGFGRKLMEKKGWKDGFGLGKGKRGISEALENEGQNPRDRSGFGYQEENEKRFKKLSTKKTAQRKVIISTVYDNPTETEPAEPLLRRHDHYKLKYRDEVLFTKSSDKT